MSRTDDPARGKSKDAEIIATFGDRACWRLTSGRSGEARTDATSPIHRPQGLRGGCAFIGHQG